MLHWCFLKKNSLLSLFYYIISAVVVNFNEDSYVVNESDGQVSISLRIDGQFFYPVWAVVEISDGTAKGGLSEVFASWCYLRSCYINCIAWNECQQVRKTHAGITIRFGIYTYSLDSATWATNPGHNPSSPIALSATHRQAMKLQPHSRHMPWSLFGDSGLSVLPACCISPWVSGQCLYYSLCRLC